MTKPKIKKCTVVFVCTGNTCRSPVAERLFKQQVKKHKNAGKYRILSAGLCANSGAPMSDFSQSVLAEAGVAHTGHKARRLSEKLIKSADFLICMTEGHKQALSHCVKPVYTVAEITGGSEVGDPYGGSIEDYRRMFDYLVYATPEIETFIAKLILA
ncbi:MAG: low molecular weight protein arginine phosphatase [Firmicutes bacterium]|nr:low molecular weight protein arginine phosphatase [Bacillota bacterium]